MNFDSNGNSAPGIHRIEYDELRTEFVANFPQSSTRSRNLDGLLSYLKIPFFADNKECFTRLWIDGSFTTSKETPNDIDGIIFVNPNVLGVEKTEELIKLFFSRIKAQGNIFYSDLYLVIDVDTLEKPDGTNQYYLEYYQQMDYQFKYWMGQFCFDRNRNPKGIFELDYKGGNFHGN
ncbi:DUF6932 family protein [Enterococcus pseudoavium]|uniref:DUF6932 family protein n=1 Tax=Enterococcus pseudoavium TaxID=44007 RepID=UPI003F98FBC6